MKFELQTLNERRPVSQTLWDFEESETLEKPIDHFETKYRLSCTIAYDFYCIPQHLEYQKAQASRAVHAYMFKDMIPLVHEILCKSSDKELQKNANTLLAMMHGE